MFTVFCVIIYLLHLLMYLIPCQWAYAYTLTKNKVFKQCGETAVKGEMKLGSGVILKKTWH